MLSKHLANQNDTFVVLSKIWPIRSASLNDGQDSRIQKKVHQLCHEDLTKIMNIHQNSTLICKKRHSAFHFSSKKKLNVPF